MNESPSLTAADLPSTAQSQGNPSAAELGWRVCVALAQLHRSGPVGIDAQAARLSELCSWVCQLHGVEIEVLGRLPQGPVIVVANHLGYIDPMVLCSLIPCSPIAKFEISSWACIGQPLERLNVKFVRRGSPASGARVLLSCLRALRRGVSVLNFPEGTTSRGGGLLPFHRGAFWLARRSGLPLLPIAMDFEDLGLCWVDDEAFLPHYVKLWTSRARRRVRVTVGEPLDPRAFVSELSLSNAARTSIEQQRRAYAGAAPKVP